MLVYLYRYGSVCRLYKTIDFYRNMYTDISLVKVNFKVDFNIPYEIEDIKNWK